ncbi:Uncharacterised protein [Escherichia coli]|uniref:Uncharacterized protein n=1 Tax=Escherichia coli TaxID=562 RepID=A0A485JN20_ECOLX|nr:Uncharacterised protein [Escherichia coli]
MQKTLQAVRHEDLLTPHFENLAVLLFWEIFLKRSFHVFLETIILFGNKKVIYS